MVKKITKIPFYLILRILLLVSYLIPKKKTVWLFGSNGGSFNGNAKYLFLYICENYPEIKAIWISKNKNTVQFLKDKNLTSYYKLSLKGLFYSLIGKVYFYNAYISNVNAWTHGNAIKVNLWHGTPMKKIEFDISKGTFSYVFNKSLKSRFFYFNHYTKPDYILSTSKKVSKIFSSAFRLDNSQCLEFGYPRNEILTYSKDKIIDFIKKYEPLSSFELVNTLEKYKKVYVYMPTWRDDGRDFIKESKIDFEFLNKVLAEKNYCLILKLHINTKLPINLNNFENIILFDNKADIYPILPFTHTLITDYSSIYFDYKLMNKEVIFFCFDKDEYIKDRGMYFDYNEIIKYELVANNFEDLISVIRQNNQEISNENLFLNQMIEPSKNLNSNKEIVKFIQSKITQTDKEVQDGRTNI